MVLWYNGTMNKVKLTSYISPTHRHKLDTVYAYYLSKGEKKSYGQLLEQAISIQFDYIKRQLESPGIVD